MLKPDHAASSWVWVRPVILFWILSNIFIVWFVRHEKTIYFWDYITYWREFENVSKAFAIDPAGAFKQLLESIRYRPYNDLAAWPIAVFAYFIDSSRLVYLLAITNLYLIPAALAFIFIRPDSEAPAVAARHAWAWFCVVALNPFLWDPVLLGFPDVGGLVAALLLLSIGWKGFNKEEALKPSSIGLEVLLLVFLPLFRRWYIFWSLSYLLTQFILVGALLFKSPEEARRRLIRTALSAILSAALFALISWPLPKEFILLGAGGKLSAYLFDARLSASLVHFADRLGLIHGLACLAGVWLAVRRGDVPRERVLFILIQWALMFALFTRTQYIARQHLYLFLPAILFFQAYLLSKLSRPASWLAALCFLLSFCQVFLFQGTPRMIGERLVGIFPGISHHAPLQRSDLPELERLRSKMLALIGDSEDKVYVASSSMKLNSDTLKYLEWSLGLERKLESHLLWTKSVDRSEGFPVYLFSAQYIVAADPIQYHLRPDDQRVVGVPAEWLLKGRGFGKHYQRLPDAFHLENGAQVSIYKKMSPIPARDREELLETFYAWYPDWRPLKLVPDS